MARRNNSYDPEEEILPVVDTLGRRNPPGKTTTRAEALREGYLTPLACAALVIPSGRKTGEPLKDLDIVKVRRSADSDILPGAWLELIVEHVTADDEDPIDALIKRGLQEVGYETDREDVYDPDIGRAITFNDPKTGLTVQKYAHAYVVPVASRDLLTPDQVEVTGIRLTRLSNGRRKILNGSSALTAVEPKAFLLGALGAIEDFYRETNAAETGKRKYDAA